MKKEILLGALGALTLGIGIFTAVTLKNKQQVSDLTLANMEAMSGIGLPPSEIVANCLWHDNRNCEVPYEGDVWDNSNMSNRN